MIGNERRWNDYLKIFGAQGIDFIQQLLSKLAVWFKNDQLSSIKLIYC